jgi:hypothetical protein
MQARAPEMGLDAFMAQYQGEDNASFEAILEEERKAKRQK